MVIEHHRECIHGGGGTTSKETYDGNEGGRVYVHIDMGIAPCLHIGQRGCRRQAI